MSGVIAKTESAASPHSRRRRPHAVYRRVGENGATANPGGLVELAELTVEYLSMWAARQAGAIIHRAETAMTDAGLDRLFALVKARLGTDPELLRRAEQEAEGEGELSGTTRERLAHRPADISAGDEEFTRALSAVVAELGRPVPADQGQNSGSARDEA